MTLLHSLSALSDDQLLASLHAAASKERRSIAEVVAHIALVDARKLYLGKACSSMFRYCVQRMHLSEDETAKRIQVARVARRFHCLLDYLAAGKVHLSGLNLLAPHLTEANHAAVLERAVGMSKRRIEELVAELAPKPDVPATVRKLPDLPSASSAAAPPASSSAPEPAATPAFGARSEDPAPARASSTPSGPRAVVQPLAPERYKVQFTADRTLRDKIEEARALLRHRIPAGDLAQVFDRALTLLVEQLKKERFGLTASPRPSSRPRRSGSRHVPNAVKRLVHERDGGRCTYVDAQGRRCTERGWIELDHIEPFARGGETTVENLRERCRAHNQLHAERTYGSTFMEQRRLL